MKYNEAFEKLSKVVSLFREAIDLLDEVMEASEWSTGKSLYLTAEDILFGHITPHDLARKLFKE